MFNKPPIILYRGNQQKQHDANKHNGKQNGGNQNGHPWYPN